MSLVFFFFFNDTATTEIYTLSLHDALPIARSFVCTRTQDASVEHRLAHTGDQCERGECAVDATVQLDDESVAAQLALQLVRRAGRDDASAIDDREPLGETVGFLEIVRREE